MGGGEPAETDSNRTGDGYLSVSRRAVLASSAAAGAAGVTGTTAAEEADESRSPLSALLLRRSDLTAPESYVEWSIDATAAPLPGHLASTLEGFAPDDGATSGFVAKATADGPGAVESAAYPDRGLAGLADATGAWVRERSPDGAETTRRRTDGTVQWETASGGGFDALRLQRLPGVVAFVGVSGEDRTRVREATDRYAGLIRARAER